MADDDHDITVIPGPENDLTVTVQTVQVSRLLVYMVENGVTSLAAACRDLGLNPRAVRRWLNKEENKNLLAEFKARELAAAVQTASSKLAEVVSKQADIALNSRDERNATRAATWLIKFLDQYGNLIPPGAEGGKVVTKWKKTWTMEGPATVHVPSDKIPD